MKFSNTFRDPRWSAGLRPGAAESCRLRRAGGRRSDAHSTFRRIWRAVLAAVGCIACADGAPLPADWQHEQSFTVASPGLVKVSVPAETLNAARPALEDLRVFSDAGSEVPYLVERPKPAGRLIQTAKTFQVSMVPGATVISIQSGLTQAIDGLTLDTPARDFIKSVKVESSIDGNRWRLLADGVPLFRQPGGIQQLLVAFSPAICPWMRVTVDDQRSTPIPFVGARVQAAAAESAPDEPLPVTIAERHENPGETRLSLQLSAAHVTLTDLELKSDEPLFSRQVQLAAPRIAEDTIVEQPLAGGIIYRIAIEGHSAVSNLSLRAEVQAPSRELLLLIRNQDSPPLPISGVEARRRPVYLVFLAHEPGIYHVLTGNNRCGAPNYDLAALGGDLKWVPLTTVVVSPVTDNPAYRPPEVLAGIDDPSAQIDVAAWRFRKPALLQQNGAQQLELDPDVLSKAQSGFQDLRLVADGKQIPYVLERTSIGREYVPNVTITNDAKDRTISRWILKLPQSRMPLTRLTCFGHTPLFQRDVELYEEVSDERGGIERRALGQASWIQTPAMTNRLLTLTLDRPPETDRILMETRNGDNPSIVLAEFEFHYPVTRILFKSRVSDNLFLYFGNPDVQSPRYDLSLVAGELVNADKGAAKLGNLEILKNAPWTPGLAGNSGVIFWGVLGLVVVALLFVIARLLPKPTQEK